jgi:hypothetical protein
LRPYEHCRRARRVVPGPLPGGRGPRLRARPNTNTRPLGIPSTREGFRETRRVNLGTAAREPLRAIDDGVEPGHTLGHRQAEVHMLLSFQRPSPPGRRGFLLQDAPRTPSLGADEYSHNSLGGAIAPNLGGVWSTLTACRKVAPFSEGRRDRVQLT